MLIPHLDRAAMTRAFLADLVAFGSGANWPERAGAAGADPLVAAGMALLLLLEALLERLDQLLQPAQRFDLGLLLRRELFLELAAQPVVRYQRFNGGIETLQAIEPGSEGAIKTVEVALILYHHGTRHLIERFHVGKYHAALDHRMQIEQLAQRHRYPGAFKGFEQTDEHASAPLIALATDHERQPLKQLGILFILDQGAG